MIKTEFTHQISVNAFLINNDRFLMLKRARKPLIWSPPGGHLLVDEDPVQGLQREIFEETRLVAEIFLPVVTWFGEFKQARLLSIDYLSKTLSMDVILSEEHTDFRWLSIRQLQNAQDIYFGSEIGFTLTHFFLAWRLYLLVENRLDELTILPASLDQ
jgi:8-oxo-dGTP diphosphatase